MSGSSIPVWVAAIFALLAAVIVYLNVAKEFSITAVPEYIEVIEGQNFSVYADIQFNEPKQTVDVSYKVPENWKATTQEGGNCSGSYTLPADAPSKHILSYCVITLPESVKKGTYEVLIEVGGTNLKTETKTIGVKVV